MSKLLLNTGPTPLYNRDGGPVPSGAIVLSDELPEDHEVLFDEGVLVYLRPADVPEDALGADGHASDAAKKHVAEWAASKPSGNAEPALRDDAGVTTTPSKGGKT